MPLYWNDEFEIAGEERPVPYWNDVSEYLDKGGVGGGGSTYLGVTAGGGGCPNKDAWSSRARCLKLRSSGGIARQPAARNPRSSCGVDSSSTSLARNSSRALSSCDRGGDDALTRAWSGAPAPTRGRGDVAWWWWCAGAASIGGGGALMTATSRRAASGVVRGD